MTARVQVELPDLLDQVLPEYHGPALVIDASDLADAFQRLREQHPQLAVHLFDERGELRQHVLCFVNGVNSRWSPTADQRLRDGDRLYFTQAVSGG